MITEKGVEGARRLAKERARGAEAGGIAALSLRTNSFQEKLEEPLTNGVLELNQCSRIWHDGKNEQNGPGEGNWHRRCGDHWYRKVDNC